jgi:sarcosine oxidase delta subunit
MDFLFLKNNLGGDFDEVHLFSDGCGKHFKTYPTHWYDSVYHLV